MSAPGQVSCVITATDKTKSGGAGRGCELACQWPVDSPRGRSVVFPVVTLAAIVAAGESRANRQPVRAQLPPSAWPGSSASSSRRQARVPLRAAASAALVSVNMRHAAQAGRERG
jgi:hypothetical protein